MNKEDFAAGYVKGYFDGKDATFKEILNQAGEHSIPKGTTLWLLMHECYWKGRDDEKTKSITSS